MARVSSKPLKQNPFQTIRDPETGKWMVVYPDYRADKVEHDTCVTAHTISMMVNRVATIA